MKINIIGHHLEITDGLKDHIGKKLKKIEGHSQEILEIKIFTGEFSDLTKNFQNTIYYKQHPLNSTYRGVEDSRDWLTSIEGYYPSFFSFWNKAKKELKY